MTPLSMHSWVVHVSLGTWGVLVAKTLLAFSAVSPLFPLLILAWRIMRRMVSDRSVVSLVHIVSIADMRAE